MILHQGKVSRSNGSTRISFEIEFADPAPGTAFILEKGLQQALNQAACAVMTEALARFDSGGEPIYRDGRTWTSKGKQSQTYQTFGGSVVLERHVYQSAKGGQTHCPMEERARTVQDATPYFASILSSKYSAQSARAVRTDLLRNSQRNVSMDYIQSLSEVVGKSTVAKEGIAAYRYETPPQQVAAVLVAADSTCTAIVKEDYKHSTVGVISLMDAQGEELERVYLANSPQDKKLDFWTRCEAEIALLKAHLGRVVPWYGICDGAEDVQNFLEQHCDRVTLDFYHLSTYMHGAKIGMGYTEASRERWVKDTLHELKHTPGAAQKLLAELKDRAERVRDVLKEEAVAKAAGYVERNLERMKYDEVRAAQMPIGSGIIEAACKYIVKQRAGIAGARWKRPGLLAVLSLRSLHESTNRWEQFWSHSARFGY